MNIAYNRNSSGGVKDECVEKRGVEPDISVICDSTRLNDNGCNGAPDWIIEIVSPGSRKMDYYKSCLNIGQQGLESIGSLTLINRLPRYIIYRKTIWKNILLEWRYL